MSIPKGVVTVEVCALPGSPSAPIVRSKIQVTPTTNAKWQATGQSLASMCNDSPIPGFVLLPAVDQAGFVTDNGSGVTGWAYVVTTSWTDANGDTGSETGTVKVYAYQSPEIVWLSTSGGEFVAPQTYPIGGLAVNGWVASYADLPTSLDESDAGKSYMVQADQRLYIWSGSAWPPNGQGFAATGPQGPTGATGATGPANTLTVGSVATGSPAQVTITGTAPNQTIDFVFPEGHWWTGSGAPGSNPSALNGDLYLDTSGNGNVYQLQSGTWVLQTSLKGPQGTTGNTGPRGSEWFTGSGAPGTVSGAQSGDFYLDTSAGGYYSYNGSTWTLQGNLTGPQGTQGPTGASSTWRTGSGAPAAGLGANGDMYLNTANGDVYGPKASGAWGSPSANIVGPAAPQATASTQGTIQLGGGDLGGSATAVTVPALANKADKATTITAGTGLTGGGDLSANRTLAVSYGTTTGTAAQGNDSRITGAVQNTRQVLAGTGLTGGGALTADVTLAVSYGTTAGTAAQGNDSRITGAAPLASPTFTGTPAAPTASAGTNSTQIATTAFVQTSAQTTGGTLAMQASKTAAYTAAAGDFVPVNASGGAVTVTLPTAPANGTRVTVMKTDTSTNAVTISCGGTTDVINVTGQTSLTLANYLGVVTLEYASAAGIWYNQESSAPAHFTWLVQSSTRATGYGDMPEGIYIPQALELLAVQFRIGTADASGTSAAQIYTNTTNASTGTALSGASVASAAWSTANTKTLVTGPWVIAAGTFVQCNVTTVGTTPGNRLYVDFIGVWL